MDWEMDKTKPPSDQELNSIELQRVHEKPLPTAAPETEPVRAADDYEQHDATMRNWRRDVPKRQLPRPGMSRAAGANMRDKPLPQAPLDGALRRSMCINCFCVIISSNALDAFTEALSPPRYDLPPVPIKRMGSRPLLIPKVSATQAP